MNKSDVKMSYFTFSFTILLLNILIVISCFVKMDNMDNKIKRMERQIIEYNYTIDSYSDKIEQYAKKTTDYTVFVDTIARKVIDKEW